MTGDRVFYTFMTRVVRPILWLLFRPRVVGGENVPSYGPLIVASNHLSFIDSFIIPLAVPRPVTYIAKADYFTGGGLKRGFVRWFLTNLGHVPVKRGARRAAMGALEQAADILDNSGAFAIYPEGTRSPDGRLYRGRTGVAWLALTSGAPVVPVAVAGTDRIQPIGARLPRIGRVRLRFGPALRFGPSAGDPIPAGRRRREITDEVMSAIQRLSDQEPAGCYAPSSPEASGIDKY
jgi:1-acyl-sn-glycerol-3-phosphate acyltransferase